MGDCQPGAAPLKELLEAFLGDYLRLVEPDVVEHLDLGSLMCLDFAGLLPDGGAELVVAQARTLQGDPLTILILVEPEPLGERAIALRLSQVFAAVEIRLGHPVLVSLLFLRGGQAGIHLATAPLTKVAGLDSVRLYFSTFGLEHAAAEHYLDRPEPLAWGLAAWMKARHLHGARLEDACRKRILAGDLDEARRTLLLRSLQEPSWRRGPRSFAGETPKL
jgi:hypothetical protein